MPCQRFTLYLGHQHACAVQYSSLLSHNEKKGGLPGRTALHNLHCVESLQQHTEVHVCSSKKIIWASYWWMPLYFCIRHLISVLNIDLSLLHSRFNTTSKRKTKLTNSTRYHAQSSKQVSLLCSLKSRHVFYKHNITHVQAKPKACSTNGWMVFHGKKSQWNPGVSTECYINSTYSTKGTARRRAHSTVQINRGKQLHLLWKSAHHTPWHRYTIHCVSSTHAEVCEARASWTAVFLFS